MKEIPSPFNLEKPSKQRDRFISQVEKLLNKYGYHQLFIAFSERFNGEEDTWYAMSNQISEGMRGYIEGCAEYMNEKLDGTMEA